MMNPDLQSTIVRTPLRRYGKPTRSSLTKIIPYDGTPLALFFLKHGVPQDKITQVLDRSRVGNALELKQGYPLIVEL